MKQRKSKERIRRFLDAIAELKTREEWEGALNRASAAWSSFFEAVVCGRGALVEEALDDDETRAFRKERTAGLTPLHAAAIGNARGVVRLLLEFGADPEAKDARGNTPGDLARLGSSTAVFAALGVRETSEARAKETPPSAPAGTREKASAETKFSGVHKAAKNGDVELLEEFLDDDESLVEKRSPLGWTPLHAAAWFDRPDAVLLLLEFGADAEAQTRDGKTARELAEENGSTRAERSIEEFVSAKERKKKARAPEAERTSKDAAPKTKKAASAKNETASKERLSGAGKFGVEDEKKEFKLSAVFSAENSGIIKALKAKKDEMTEEDKKNVAHLEAMNPVSQAWILAKSIAGLANARGGKIYVGVSDSGRLVGLEKDFEAENLASEPENKRWDKFEMKVRTRIEGMFRNKTVAGALFRMEPVKKQGRIFCVVVVDEAKAPIYVCKEPETRRWRRAKKDNFEEFYLRRGVATKIVPVEELKDYLKQRFPDAEGD